MKYLPLKGLERIYRTETLKSKATWFHHFLIRKNHDKGLVLACLQKWFFCRNEETLIPTERKKMLPALTTSAEISGVIKVFNILSLISKASLKGSTKCTN